MNFIYLFFRYVTYVYSYCINIFATIFIYCDNSSLRFCTFVTECYWYVTSTCNMYWYQFLVWYYIHDDKKLQSPPF